MRGKNYYLGRKLDHSTCRLTFWELLHLVIHTWIGYEYGLAVSLLVSIGYEVMEVAWYDCASWVDLLWNILGASVGVLFRMRDGRSWCF